MGKLLEPSQNIERSIMKKYRKELWNPFIKAVKNYELVQENDKIAVCISRRKGFYADGKADAAASALWRCSI